MRVLYLGRGEFRTNFAKRWLHKLRQSLYFSDQDGFFEQSLFSQVEVIPYTFTSNIRTLAKECDVLLVNWKQPSFKTEEARIEAIDRVVKMAGLPCALFINAAQAQYLPSETVLDNFDIIFKREPFKDRNRYNISEANKAKIVPTMIHCPFVHAPRNNWFSNVYRLVRTNVPVCRPGEAVYDVGFSGADAAEHSLRRDVWQKVLDAGFSTIGGLQPNPFTKLPISKELQGLRFKGRKYRDSLCRSKINLALDGIGQYTFRHQELLFLGAFMMSSPSIREVELPMPLKENVHYVAFDNLDDMVEKIRYYLTHEDERLRIATAGKKLFDEFYNSKRHGQEIAGDLQRILLRVGYHLHW